MNTKFKVFWLSNTAKANGKKAVLIDVVDFGDNALVIPTLDLWNHAQELAQETNLTNGLVIFADYDTRKVVHTEKIGGVKND